MAMLCQLSPLSSVQKLIKYWLAIDHISFPSHIKGQLVSSLYFSHLFICCDWRQKTPPHIKMETVELKEKQFIEKKRKQKRTLAQKIYIKERDVEGLEEKRHSWPSSK